MFVGFQSVGTLTEPEGTFAGNFPVFLHEKMKLYYVTSLFFIRRMSRKEFMIDTFNLSHRYFQVRCAFKFQ